MRVHAFTFPIVAVTRIAACDIIGTAVLTVGIGVDTETVANKCQTIAAAEYAFAFFAGFFACADRRAVAAMHGIALKADAFAIAERLAVFIAIVFCFSGCRTAGRICTFIVAAFVGTAYAAAGRGVSRAGEIFIR